MQQYPSEPACSSIPPHPVNHVCRPQTTKIKFRQPESTQGKRGVVHVHRAEWTLKMQKDLGNQPTWTTRRSCTSAPSRASTRHLYKTAHSYPTKCNLPHLPCPHLSREETDLPTSHMLDVAISACADCVDPPNSEAPAPLLLLAVNPMRPDQAD
jgi:hypothetical protein